MLSLKIVAPFAVGAGLFSACIASAEDVSPGMEANRFLEAHQKIPDIGPTPFGESINLYTGELSFRQTDIRLEGKGPAIVIARTTRSSQDLAVLADGVIDAAFGTWDLSVPRIETLVMTPTRTLLGTPGENWRSGIVSPNQYRRCTDGMVPYNAMPEWWRGIQLFTEEGGQQTILMRGPENPNAPKGQVASYPYLTAEQWQISCLPGTANGELGEAFQVLSPDGNKYTLNYLTGTRASTIVEMDYSTGGPRPVRIFTGRMLARMNVTRVEDRFGNYLAYQYTGDKLTGITASDGREVAITWRSDLPIVSSITVQPGTISARTWHYEYTSTGTLTSVVMPDGSYWSYSGALTSSVSFSHPYQSICGWGRDSSNFGDWGSYDVSVTAPSGVTGTFTVKRMWHARNYVPSGCVPASDPSAADVEGNPPLFGAYSVIKKNITGPGVPIRSWIYDYSPAIGSANRDPCATSNICPETSWVDVISPDNSRVRYTYSNRWGISEGRLIQTQWYDKNSVLSRTEIRNYAPPIGGAYPVKLGTYLMNMGLTNVDKIEQLAPLRQVDTIQQGRTFTWRVANDCPSGYCFDQFARPTKVTRENSP